MPITKEVIDTALRMPDDSVLAEVKRFFPGNEGLNNKELIDIAEKLLDGEVAIPKYSFTRIGLPFCPDDLNKMPVCGFNLSNHLLSAYEITGRQVFINAARDMISAFASYERKAWLPRGFLWNDHAIAARIPVLARFWRLYRNHADYDPGVARNIFPLITRSARLLAKKSHFTSSSNHGFMQNLALLQICVAFPNLVTSERFKQVAFERIRDQMRFYINDEGVVLEHSAGYQKAGLEFISAAFRYLTLMNIAIPDEWRKKYQRAKDFYAQLRRPDGSLPMFGDTHNGSNRRGPLVTTVDAIGKSEILQSQEGWIPRHSNSLYPVAGYSIWWDGLDEWPNEKKLRQTVVTWSYFSEVHKHADEMSVLLWAGGKNWWTNVGYWPYGTKGRSDAVSWAGSNAPHLLNEKKKSVRHTTLMSYGWSDSLSAIDMERRGLGGYTARRQVVHVKPNLWMIVDHASGNENDQNTIVWTTSHDIQLRQGTIPGSYMLETAQNNATLTKFIIGSEGTKIKQFTGSFSPFAGWEVNKPASALVIEQPADDSWAVAIWSIQDKVEPTLQFTKAPTMEHWESPGKWKVVLPFDSGVLSISRENDRINICKEGKDATSKGLVLTKAPDVRNEIEKILAESKAALSKYQKVSYYLPRLWKATYFLIFLFLLQEIFLMVYGKWKGRYDLQLRVLCMVAWIGGTVWLHAKYL